MTPFNPTVSGTNLAPSNHAFDRFASGGSIMKILLAIDGSVFSDRAVQEVVHRPWPAATEVKIISVVEPMVTMMTETWVLPDNYWEGAEVAATEQAQATLDEAVARFKE